jgi:hypothetical protein
VRNFHPIGTFDHHAVSRTLADKPELWNTNPDRVRAFNLVAPAAFDDIWIHMPDSTASMTRDQVMARLADLPHANRWHDAYWRLPVRPVLDGILSALHGEAFGRVFISRVPPGGAIFRHSDKDNLCFLRTHFSIESAPGQVFECGGEEFTPAPGQVFWFDHSLEHSVRNESDRDRITMVVDVVSPLLPELLRRPWMEKSE